CRSGLLPAPPATPIPATRDSAEKIRSEAISRADPGSGGRARRQAPADNIPRHNSRLQLLGGRDDATTGNGVGGGAGARAGVDGERAGAGEHAAGGGGGDDPDGAGAAPVQ